MNNIVNIPRRALKRLINYCNYNTALFPRSFKSKDVKDALEMIGPIKSCAIIGRGSSIKHCNPIKQISKCDFKIIMNRVEIENLKSYSGNTIDAQIAQPPGGLFTALPKKYIKDFNVKLLISNKLKESEEFRVFYSFYYNRGATICCVPEDVRMKYDFCKYKYPHRTQCGTILKILYNIDSLEKIVFAGVDFFRFNYLHEGKDRHIFPEMHENAKEEKGDPLLKFILETVPKRNSVKPLTVYFPSILKPLIDFPDLPCFNFYEGFQQ